MFAIRASLLSFIGLLVFTFTGAPAHGATLPAGFAETRIATGLASPTAMAFAPDGRLFVAQQGGALRVIKNGALLSQPFLTLSVNASGERGLLGVAFDPNFATNGYVYMYYAPAGPEPKNVLARFHMRGDSLELSSKKVLLEVGTQRLKCCHTGGSIDFDAKGNLYVSTGDNSNPFADYTETQLYEFLGGYALPRDTGERYEYSNLAVGLLGQALSRRAGQDFETLVRTRITGPLGMTDTAVALSPAMKTRLAPGHTATLEPAANWDLPTMAGAGALRSTTNDLLTFLAAELGFKPTPLKAAMDAQRVPRRKGPPHRWKGTKSPCRSRKPPASREPSSPSGEAVPTASTSSRRVHPPFALCSFATAKTCWRGSCAWR